MRRVWWLAVAAAAAFAATACGGDDADTLIIYSGRSETLVDPIIQRFEDETGIDVEVRYGGTAELAATILDEGGNSPADVFFAQDAGALGLLSDEGKLAILPDNLLAAIPAGFQSSAGDWVGVSGRVRVVAYNVANVDPADLPDSILGFTDPEWKGRIGWPVTNSSFHSFVTGLRALEGEAVAKAWLEGIKANGAREYSKNSTTLQAVASGEVDVGFVNHYYLFRFLAEEGEAFGARNYYLAGDAGGLVNVAGVAILKTSNLSESAERFVEFLLSEDSQRFFADETYEYPLVAGVDPYPDLPTLEELDSPLVELNELADLRGTIALLQEVGILP
jgi:iron(III) transport system substrate-binding protein